MFKDASSFNSAISSWDVGKVTEFQYIFNGASEFHQFLCWNIVDDALTFGAFGTPQDNGGTFGGFGTPQDDIDDGTFWAFDTPQDSSTNYYARVLINQALDSIQAGFLPFPGCLSMNNEMFATALKTWVSDRAKAIGNFGTISHWDTSQVTDMSNAFANLVDFNEDISSWNVSQVTDMQAMFASARSFNVDISSWDVGRVRSMRSMFWNAHSFNVDLSPWDVSRVADFFETFRNTYAFDQGLCWNVTGATNRSNMFRDSGSRLATFSSCQN